MTNFDNTKFEHNLFKIKKGQHYCSGKSSLLLNKYKYSMTHIYFLPYDYITPEFIFSLLVTDESYETDCSELLFAPFDKFSSFSTMSSRIESGLLI